LIHIGGANDLGAIKQDETLYNLSQMIRAAKKAGATPILLSPTPSRGDHLKARPIAKVQALRDEMQKLANDEKIAWVDVYSLVADAKGELREDITRDGLHLKAEGYALLRPTVTTAIDDALAGKKPGIVKKIEKTK
jgi:lysophospholipase L1-like esterase